MDPELEFAMNLNEKLADEVSFLRDEIRFLREILFKAMEKGSKRTAEVPQMDFEPIQGYVSAKDKVANMEKESKEKYEQENKEQTGTGE